MRDLLLAVCLGYLIIKAIRQPWVGILGWTWISIMNPHTLSWHMRSMPVAAAVGGATLIGMFISRQKNDYSVQREGAMLMVFMAWVCITLPFSYVFDESFDAWKRVMKIDLMILVAMVLLSTKRHIILLAWVLVVSIGFFGVKGGIFTVLTGGNFKVWGPEGTYIEGNNEVALAFVMTIPLMRFVQTQLVTQRGKMLMTFCMASMAAAALGSHSRGALLALGSMGLMLWWRGKNKGVGAILMVAIGVGALAVMPEEWWSRMHTIKTYEQDQSAMGRINAWWMAFNLAKDNFFGGGLSVAQPGLFARYAPDPTDIHAAHSIYFMVLGEQGFIGLFIFLLMFGFVWGSAEWIRVRGRKQPQTQWLSELGAMCQVSLVGYAVGGAFLSLSYWDFPYNILILVVLARRWLDRKKWLTEPVEPILDLPPWLAKWFHKKKPKAVPAP